MHSGLSYARGIRRAIRNAQLNFRLVVSRKLSHGCAVKMQRRKGSEASTMFVVLTVLLTVEYSPCKIVFDTAENLPCEVCLPAQQAAAALREHREGPEGAARGGGPGGGPAATATLKVRGPPSVLSTTIQKSWLHSTSNQNSGLNSTKFPRLNRTPRNERIFFNCNRGAAASTIMRREPVRS